MKKQTNKIKNRRTSSALALGVTVAGSALIAGCASTSSSSTTTDSSVTISGKMSATSSSARQAVANGRLADGDILGQAAAVSLTSYKASCVTLGTSPSAGSGTFDSTGKFSVKIDGAKGKKLGCFILDSSESVVATMVFSDSSKKSMSGSASSSTSTALSDNAELGDIALDLDTGKATVDVANIKTSSGTSAVASSTATAASSTVELVDFTGKWKIGEYTGATDAEKKLYKTTLCDNTHKNADGTDCNGPPKDQTVYIRRVAGKASDGSKAYAMMLWGDDALHQACSGGGTDRYLGATYAAVKDKTGVDFTDSGLVGKEFTYTSTVTISGASQTLTDGWKASGATAQWTQRNCAPVAGGGFKCTDGAGKTRTDYGGGCINSSTKKPVKIEGNGWSSVVMTSCSSSTDAATGIITNTCSGTYSGTGISCANKYKEDSGFNYSTVGTVVSSGALCSTISETTYPLLQAQCYANYYWQYVQSAKSQSGCFKNMRFNYGATSLADFVSGTSDKPDALIFRNLVEYNDDGTVVTMHEEVTEERGIRQMDNGKESFVNCNVLAQNDLMLTKVDASTFKAVYKSVTKNASKDKPACEASFGGTGKEDSFLFSMTKQ